MLRIQKHRSRAFLVDALQHSPAVAAIPDEWEDLVLVDLRAGQRIAIYMIDRSINLEEIHQTLAQNRRANIYTVFILWAAMLLPEHGQIYEPEDWMAELEKIYGGYIYSYQAHHDLVDIFPVLFRGQGVRRHVFYGPLIDVERLRCLTTDDGWLVADFEDTAGLDDEPEVILAAEFKFEGLPHEILGIPAEANREVIRLAYRRMARRFHPDVDDSQEATVRMQVINDAYREMLRQLKAS